MQQHKNSKTALNLMKAFAGESQARNRYTFYASRAKKEGLMQIADIFLETADNEKEHAKLFYNSICMNAGADCMLDLSAAYPVAFSEDTMKNLDSAADGEHEEWANLYPDFAVTAEEEGFKDAERIFKGIAQIEKKHEERYRNLSLNLKNGQVFKKTGKVLWKCKNCGYIMEASEAPKKCPVCEHPQAYFEVFNRNY